MSFIGFLINYIHRSFFLRGEEGFRKTCFLYKVLFIIVTLYTFIVWRDYICIVYLFILFMLLSLFDQGLEWIYSASILSSIPATWYALTTFISQYLGLINESIDVFMIFTRTFLLSYMIIFYASIISLSQIYNLLLKLGFRKQALLPLLIWRITPYSLVNMLESLSIARLKREKISSRIAPAIASIIEIGEQIRESSYYKICRKPLNTLPEYRSLKHNIVLIITIIITIIYNIVMMMIT